MVALLDFGQFSCPLSCEQSPSSSSDADHGRDLNAARLLELAIQKRRAAFTSRRRDFRREIAHTVMVRTLCRRLGAELAMKRKKRLDRAKRLVQSMKCKSDCILHGEEVLMKSPLSNTRENYAMKGKSTNHDAESSNVRNMENTKYYHEDDPFDLDRLFEEAGLIKRR